MSSRLLMLFLACLFQGDVDCLQWQSSSSSHQDIIYACTGEQVKILWQFDLDSTTGEEVADIRWYFSGRSQELIAVWADNAFLPLPAYHSRVEEYGNAGFILNNVTLGDSGNYSVMISIHNAADDFLTIRRSVTVQIGDTLMTQDGQLHVTQKPEAVLDTSTNEWAIELQCGTFTYLADPPFPVEWTTPSSAQVRASSDYSSNHFSLLLPDPVTGGTYTCRIPAQHTGTACLLSNETDRAEANLYVDKVLARLSLLESENKQLKEELQQANFTCP